MPTDEQNKMIDECIESYRRLIKFHRQQILELTRMKNNEYYKMEKLDIKIKGE
tara:strand:+ start:6948 stop:7106 length:159 start_codon:yes stop_codon:yes gene_type:complete